MEELYTIDEVAEHLGMTRGALATMRYEGKGPLLVKLTSRQIRYRASDLDEWIESRVRESTAAKD